MLSQAQVTALALAARDVLAGAQVADVSSGALDSLVLHLRAAGDRRSAGKLWLVLRRGLARVVATRLPGHRLGGGEPTGFARESARLLAGRTLLDIEVAADDRWVAVHCDGSQRRSLVAELFGQPGSAYLIDEHATVLATSRAKPRIAVGARYERPLPPRDRAPAAPPIAVELLEAESDAELAAAIERERAGALVEREQQQVTARLGKDRRLVSALAADLAATEHLGELRQHADLIMANLTRLARGESQVTLPGFDGVPVTIALDPALAPVQVAEKLYHRARKLERARPVITERLARLRAQVTALEGELAGLEALRHGDPAVALERLGRRSRAPAPAPRREREAPGARPREYRSAEGLLIRVGRDDRDNDRLTASAHGNDLWLHAQAVAGSHVLVRLPKGRSASLDTIRDASLLAVHFSKLRGAARADVMYTPCKFVRRVKGRPGQVTVARHKTYSATSDAVRLRQLLGQADHDA